MTSKTIRASLVKQGSEARDKPNSRVTRKHIEQLLDAMAFATNSDVDGYQRLGYLSFAVAGILKDVGYPSHYEEMSKRMWANFGKPS